MRLEKLASTLYRDLRPEQIVKLVPLEAVAVCEMPPNNIERIEHVFAECGVPFTHVAIRFYAQSAEHKGNMASAAAWHRRLAKVTGEKESLRRFYLRVGWFLQTMDTFKNKAEAAAYVLPAFRRWLEKIARNPVKFPFEFEKLMETAELLQMADKKILNQTARVILHRAIRLANRDIIDRCLMIIARLMTMRERRVYLSARLKHVSALVIETAGSSPLRVAQEIVDLEMTEAFGHKLRHHLMTVPCSLKSICVSLETVGLTAREEDLLRLRMTHLKHVYGYEEAVRVTERLVEMNEVHAPLLQKTLLHAREMALSDLNVQQAHIHAQRCGVPLTQAELRSQLFALARRKSECVTWHHEVDQLLAELLLTRLLVAPTTPSRSASTQDEHSLV